MKSKNLRTSHEKEMRRKTRAAKREIATREWTRRAACKDVPVEVFYPDSKQPEAYDEAKKICRSCPVEQLCLDWAVRSNDMEGMHGGKTPDEQRAERRRRLRSKTLHTAI